MELKESLKKFGYCVVPNVLTNDEVALLRVFLDNEFSQHVNSSVIADKFLINNGFKYSEIYLLALNELVVKSLKSVLGDNYTMIPDLHIQRNCYGFPGWHTDAGSEGRALYLTDPEYKFVKCGVFLQENSLEWGGGITVVSGGHKFPLNLSSLHLKFRAKELVNKIARLFWPTIVKTKPGDLVFFDSRLPHCSTLPSDAAEISISNSMFANIPNEYTKYVVYWDACATDSFLGNFLANSERRQKDTGGFDYINMSYPDSYPKDFVDRVEVTGIKIASIKKIE